MRAQALDIHPDRRAAGGISATARSCAASRSIIAITITTTTSRRQQLGAARLYCHENEHSRREVADAYDKTVPEDEAPAATYRPFADLDSVLKNRK